ncbi:MAG TPA: hypothetical protein VND99_02465 [Candidatus Acidoferrales bacterium]|nr:hypothetical protein [Candidatus Acidoferrales bacterium]
MKKQVKKQKKRNLSQISLFLILFLLFCVTIVVLPSVETKKFSYGATNTAAIPFTPAPAQSNLQMDWFLVPTGTSPSTAPSKAQTQPANPNPAKPNKQTQTKNPLQPVNSAPQSPIGHFQPAAPGPKAPVSNGQPCPGGFDSGKPVTGSCYCTALTVTCKNGIGYGANGALYPGPNPCGTKIAPGSGRYCVEKPVIYLYPTVPTLVDVQVITNGSVVVSDPTYPQGGWKDVLANPNGTLSYNGKKYSELFYESSVTDFQQPHLGVTIPKSQLTEKLGSLLDELGLVGPEKQEFLSFWLPQLKAMPTPYIFFSVLTPSAKAAIDTVAISPKPDTQIAFIAYFKAALTPAKDTLQLPATPKRQGFVSVEWGGVIDTK